MNLLHFLEEVDRLSAECSAPQLAAFIHQQARLLPEQQRPAFLESLLNTAGRRQEAAALAAEASGTDGADGADEENPLLPALADAQKYLRLLSADEESAGDDEDGDEEEEELTSERPAILVDLNEEYDDWYNSEEGEFIYSDPEGIGTHLNEIAALVHSCLDQSLYAEGLELGEELLNLVVPTGGDYGSDVDPLTIDMMQEYGLIDFDTSDLLLDTLCCGYLASESTERPAVLWRLFNSLPHSGVTLEDILRHTGDELPDTDVFLQDWITCLGEQTGRLADRLLTEAVGMLPDVEAARECARKYSTAHPALYGQILDTFSTLPAAELVQIGQEAMERIPANSTQRADIALRTAGYLLAAGDPDRAARDACYLAAFTSQPEGVSYLRALCAAEHPQQLRGQMHELISQVPTTFPKYSIWTDCPLNGEAGHLYALHYLDGDFETVLEKGLNTREALGWSGTFNKQGIALLLLACYAGERPGRQSTPGLADMMDRVAYTLCYTDEEYSKGLSARTAPWEKPVPDERGRVQVSREQFWPVFCAWKAQTPMDEELRGRILAKIDRMMRKRTAGIMQANRRNYYGECAAFIAALGEVRESLGERGARQQLMASYRAEYPRRTAFRAELKNYGWSGH